MKFDDEFYESVRKDAWVAAGVGCGGYNSDVDDLLIRIVELIVVEGPIFCDAIAREVGESPQFVELVQYVLCSAEWCEYGTSPRGCFAMPGLDGARLLKSMREWREEHWREQ